MKYVLSGLESSGKSLRLIMILSKIVQRNAKYQQKSGVQRPVALNFPLTSEFESWIADHGVPLVYWNNVDELIKLENCDVFIDEIAVYFDARGWESLSLDARRWLSQGAKRGIEIYGATQDFAMVDKAFRRLVNQLVHIRKALGSRRPSATTPPVKRIWGICLMVELDPQTYNEDDDKFATKSLLSFRFFLIQKRYCLAYDTTAKIKMSDPPKLKHIERICEDEKCAFHRLQHV